MDYYDKYNNKKYKIIVNDNIKMIDYFKYFIKNKNKNKYLGIDLEFNAVSKTEKTVALIQINLEINNNGIIYIFDPNSLNQKQINILIKLLVNKNIIKIMHGTESLDIPYLFDQLLNKNKKLIYDFLLNFYDTKYLCEYKHIIENKINKCSIYDLYLEMDVINKKQYKYLNEMSQVYDVNEMININNLKPKFIEYAYYDVIYLVSLYNKFIKTNYYNFVNDVTKLNFYYKKNDDLNYNNLKLFITKYNNYFIIIKNENIKMDELYNLYFNLYLNKIKYFNSLFEIHYFKFFLENITKYFVYKILFDKYKIYEKKNYIVDNFNSTIYIKKIINLFNKKIHVLNILNKIKL